MRDDTGIALVAITLGFMAIAYMTYLSHQPHQSVQPTSEVWEVKSDKQGIPERIVVRR